MRFNAHISYKGDCETAFEFYRDCLRGEITLMMRYEEAPGGPRYPALIGKIVHATLKVGDQVLTCADVLTAEYERPAGFAMQLNIKKADEAKRVYDALSLGAKDHDATAGSVLGEKLCSSNGQVWNAMGDQLRLRHLCAPRNAVLTP